MNAVDIIFEKVVSHVDAEIKICPRCNRRNKGHFPEEMSGPLQYGPGIKGYVVNLPVAQMISLKRVQQMIRTLIGQVLSEASILKYVLQLHHALEAWEASSIEQLLQMPTIHVDETSLRVDRKNHWIHVCSAGDITLKFLHPKRGQDAIEAIGIIPCHSGVIIHDCWQSYLSYDHLGHGLCGSHLLRELTFIVDSNGYAWAANMKRLRLHEMAVLLFAKVSTVPFTNNRAERDLRMSKVKQKVSGCFRTEKYAEAYCRISSYLQTMARKGYNPLVAIQMAFSGQLYADRGE